jgi:predicted MFS family arabinose efflux permease
VGRFTASELRILWLVCAVQIVNMTDSMMIFPLGPEFVIHLNIPTANIGIVGGSYVASACVAGLAGSLILDRFDRRSALGVAMLGLFLGTTLGGFATDLHQLIASRVIAGFFGGPASAISLAIIGDTIPVDRRARAMGLVSGSFALASIFGVPVGLQLAVWGGWSLPFFCVGGLGLLVGIGVYSWLPAQRAHLSGPDAPVPREAFADLVKIARRPASIVALLANATNIVGGSLLISIMATYFTFNLGFPRDELGWMWMGGGFTGFIGGNVAGRFVDRYGPVAPMWIFTLCSVTAMWVIFVLYRPGWPVMPIFAFYVMLNLARGVTVGTVISKVPPMAERGRFMSLMSTAQHAASAVSAFTASFMLTETAGGALVHVDRLTYLAIVFTAIVPVLIAILHTRFMPGSSGVTSSGERLLTQTAISADI